MKNGKEKQNGTEIFEAGIVFFGRTNCSSEKFFSGFGRRTYLGLADNGLASCFQCFSLPGNGAKNLMNDFLTPL